MRLEYEVTQADVIKQIEYGLERKQLKGTGCFVGGAILFLCFSEICILLWNIMHRQILEGLITMIMTGALIALFMFFYSKYTVAKHLLQSAIKNGEFEMKYFGRHTLELQEDGVLIQYDDIQTIRRYAGIVRVEEYSAGIAVYYSQIHADIIPSRAFYDLEGRIEFLNELQSRMILSRDEAEPSQRLIAAVEQAEYTLEYTWDEPGFVNAMTRARRYLYQTKLGWDKTQIISTLIGCMLLFIVVVKFIPVIILAYRQLDREMLSSALTSLLVVGILSIAFLCNHLLVFIPAIGHWLVRKQISKGLIARDYFMSQTICFGTDRITEVRRQNTENIMYDRLYCVMEDEKGMYILLKGKKAIVIPNEAFRSSSEREMIAAYISRKIAAKSISF